MTHYVKYGIIIFSYKSYFLFTVNLHLKGDSMKVFIGTIALVLFLILFTIGIVYSIFQFFVKRNMTSRYCKVLRNLFASMTLCALASCLCFSLFPFSGLFYPLLAVPIFLINTILYHKDMKIKQEIEEVKEKLMKF